VTNPDPTKEASPAAVDRDRLESAELVAALREGIAQVKRGETMPLEEAMKRIREKHGLPS
jgi:predicted transcriptional regulator